MSLRIPDRVRPRYQHQRHRRGLPGVQHTRLLECLELVGRLSRRGWVGQVQLRNLRGGPAAVVGDLKRHQGLRHHERLIVEGRVRKPVVERKSRLGLRGVVPRICNIIDRFAIESFQFSGAIPHTFLHFQ